MKNIFLFAFGALLISSVECCSQSAKDYYESGSTKLKTKNYSSSIDDFSKAIALDPNYTDAYFFRGLVKTLIKDSTAQSDFSKTIELEPGNAEAYGYRGVAKFNMKKYEEAIVDFNVAIKLKPTNAEIYFYKGSALMELKKYEESIAELNKAIELKVTYTGAYYMRGLTEFMKKDYTSAITDFNKTASLNPDYSIKLFYFRGMSEQKAGQKEQACADLKKSLDAGYKDAEDMIKKYCQ